MSLKVKQWLNKYWQGLLLYCTVAVTAILVLGALSYVRQKVVINGTEDLKEGLRNNTIITQNSHDTTISKIEDLKKTIKQFKDSGN